MGSISVSVTEENYLKGIYKLSENLPSNAFVQTNAIAEMMHTRAASVSDMIQRLAEKKLLDYTPYKGVKLSPSGKQVATDLLRKHRLWEVFLLEKLQFTWAEVHPIAEQLEHIQSEELTNRLDAFLDYPKFDPHGDPIPDEKGNFRYKSDVLLSDLKKGETGVIVGVKEHSAPFLGFLESVGLVLGVKVEVEEYFPFDHSIVVRVNGEKSQTITHKVSTNLLVQ